MSELRVRKLNELIRRETSKIIFDFSDAPSGVLITITRVVTAADLFSAVVFVSIWPDSEVKKIFAKLNRSIYQIQQLLNKKLKIRPVPKIIFRYDKNPEEASEVEKLFKEIKEEK